MIAFLIKVRVKTMFSIFDPIKVEPLELCYLKTVMDRQHIENYIIDDLFGAKAPEGIVPDIVLLNGYCVAEEKIVRLAGFYKAKYPRTKIIAGGVHVQGNPRDFHVKGIDYVFHSQSLREFEMLIEKIGAGREKLKFEGADTYMSDGEDGKGYWHTGIGKTIYENENIMADRSFFQRNPGRFHYLEKRNVALIKGSIGCPHACSFCYCKEINHGRYVRADYDRMAEEMEKIKADYFWIVDDVLFSDRADAVDFIQAVKNREIKGGIIGYLRADFILREKDLLKSLREIGIVELIIGFEAINNRELEGYNKTTDALDYPAVISLLNQNDIDLTALFMVKPDYGFKDFSNLRRFIRENKISVFTTSVLTPIKGTEAYERMKSRLTTQNPRKFDFLHLVIKPELPKPVFYALFYGSQLGLLKSERVRKYIFKKTGDKI